ncbi:MAG: hypothetical protein ABWX90_03750 [Candidatus Saccharimonadales bacterium]
MSVEPHAVVIVDFDTPLTGRQVAGIVERAVNLPESNWAPRRLYVTKVYGYHNTIFLTQMSGFPDAQVAISENLDAPCIVLDQLYTSIYVYDVTWPVGPTHSVDSEYVERIKCGVVKFARKIRDAYAEALSIGRYPESSDC